MKLKESKTAQSPNRWVHDINFVTDLPNLQPTVYRQIRLVIHQITHQHTISDKYDDAFYDVSAFP